MAVKILMGKTNIPSVFNWIPDFNEMATSCDVPGPVSTVDDFRFVLVACFVDARRAKARSVYHKYTVTGNSEARFGDIKAVSFRKRLMEYSVPVCTYNHSCVIIEIYYS